MWLIFAYAQSPAADPWTAITALATVGLFAVACVAGGIAKQQIGKSNDQLMLQQQSERRQRVYDHLSRLYERDFLHMTVEFQSLSRARPKSSCGWERQWKKRSDEQKTMIMAVLNFYEVVAGEYNDPEQLLDRAVADKALAAVLDEIWLRAEPFVRWLRKKYDLNDAYNELERMHIARAGV